MSKGFPDWLERVEVPKKDGTVHHPLVNDTRSLLWLANQNTHHAARLDVARARLCTTPTSASSISIRRTKTIPTCCARRRSALRDLLEELGLPSWVKTSGSKGFHIVVPLDGKADDRRGRRGSRTPSARLLVTRDPEHLTQEFSKADRGGRILVDTGRNGYSATFAAAYAVRAKPGAPVSAPCTWEEIERGDGRAANVHAADHGRADGPGWRSLGGPRESGTVAA